MSEGASVESASLFSYIYRFMFFAPIFAIEWTVTCWLMSHMYREMVEAWATAKERRRRE